MSKNYKIRDLADEFNVTTRTLRFYEEKGLLDPRRENNNRIYSSADRTRLRLILRGKRLGLTLEESSSIIMMYDPDKKNTEQLRVLIEKIRQKRIELLQQQKDLDLMLVDLDRSEAQCLKSLNAIADERTSEET